mgnify:CR=1 FL=1
MKEKKYALYGIGVVLISLIGISLAYFATQIVGKEKDISVNTKDLRIIFNNGDAITGENVVAEDNWSMTKTFSVENKSNSTYKYNIVIKDLINTFKTTGYLQYKITSTDGGYNMTNFEDVPKSSKAQDIALAYNISIDEGTTQNYTITIQYPNDENADQSDDMGTELSGKLYISEGGYPTLTYAILRDNPTISERTDFSVINTADTTGTIYQTNKTEDGSTVYYYSGNTTNNWVKFGKYSTNGPGVIGYYSDTDTRYKLYNTMDKCTSATSYNVNCSYIWNTGDDIYWRIIRTNEDGSVRLLYSGNNHNTVSSYISGQMSCDIRDDTKLCMGYMYGTSDSLENNRTNENDSSIKAYTDTWYENNLFNNYDKYISKSAIYCNDRSTTNEYTDDDVIYGACIRLQTNYAPSYKCGEDGNGRLFESTQAVADKFSASTTGGGNGQLKYPIALLTADEVTFAGGVSGTNTATDNTKVWYYLNSVGDSITGGKNIYTMSPYNVYSYHAFLYTLINSYRLTAWNYGAIRPVLSLSSCVKVSGNGTPESPYVIDYENSCK